MTVFEPVDLLRGILMTVKQLEAGTSEVENAIPVWSPEGNPAAQALIQRVFEPCDRNCGGIGNIPEAAGSLITPMRSMMRKQV